MTTLAELARIRAVHGLAPVGGVLWLGIGMLPPKRNAIEIDPANLPTVLECRAVAGLDVVLLFPGTSTRYGVLRTLSDRLYQARPRRLLLVDSDHSRTAFLKLAES
ncbi:hypothetical protein [Pseudoduganella aquatica]|uniref:Uncharacterized protein n=1 Tax=Pseudoduganella aquatica TaxID=2660641 RepID=A0A7X4HHM5_9BURK|nr:hypothetical protein [Pseudoduganella aquatica]MYN10295.1 hypothetical protein [Pseudoduganella aquatica]